MESLQNTYQPNYQSQIDYYRKVGTSQPPQPVAPPVPLKTTHVTIIVDASGSMAAEMNGKRKIDLVKEKVQSFVETLPKETIVTLKVYGHKGSAKKQDKAISCQSDEIVYQSPILMREQLHAALQQIDAKGYAPLARALESQDNMVLPPNTEQKIIVLADGLDNCGGEVKETIQKLQVTRQAKVDMIAINPSDTEKEKLQTLSEETGGDFRPVRDDQQLDQALLQQKQSISLNQRTWQERALEEITQEYRAANNQLKDQYTTVESVIETEHQRLKEANYYIYVRKMIERKDYLQIQNWIDQRKIGLDTYSVQKWQEAGKKLDADYEKSAEQIIKENQTPPNVPNVLKERKKQLDKELKLDKNREKLPKLVQDEVDDNSQQVP
jgi:hypothetical protein